MISRRSLAFVLVLFSITALAQAGRNVILGDWYWPKGAKNWAQVGTKKPFAPGDYVIIMDDRVVLGFGSNRGDIPYYLNATGDNIPYLTHGPIRVTELVTNRVVGPYVQGANGQLVSEFEGHAILIPIPEDSYPGSLDATFFYIDPEKRASGLSILQSLLEPPVERLAIATIVRDTALPPATPHLAIQSAPSSVLVNSTFTLTAQLSGVDFTAGQTTTTKTTYVWTQTASAGIPLAAVLGPPDKNTITYKAPGVEGTLTFKVTAKISATPDVDSSPITISVVKQVTQPPPITGTPFGKPAAGKRAAVATNFTIPQDAKINTPFTLIALANDPDGTVPPCDSTVVTCPPDFVVPSLKGKWERVVGGNAQFLQDWYPYSPVANGEQKSFSVTITETNPETYTYRFTVKNAVDAGNYYDVQVTVGTGVPVNNGPVIKFATSPPTLVDVDTVVTLDASGSTTITGKDLQFTWTLKIDNNDLTFTNISTGKISFRVPLSAVGKKIVGKLTVKDVENKQSIQSFEINVSIPPIRALSFPAIRGIANRPAKSDNDISTLDATAAPQFINFIAILNPAGEQGKKEPITVRSVDGDGNKLSEYYKTVGLGPDSFPFTGQIEQMIPELAQTDSQVVRLDSLSRLAGVGMLKDNSPLPRMDAFDLSSSSGTDWVLPYLFKNNSREGLGRESFGIVSIQNTSNEEAEVRGSYFTPQKDLIVPGPNFTLKAGGSMVRELSDYFSGLGKLPDPAGYATFTANKNIQVLAFYGDNREMFSVPGVRKEDFVSAAVAPVAFRSNEWETVITLINPQDKNVNLTLQLLNTSVDFPVDLKGKQFPLVLKPGANDVTLAELIGKPVDVPFTALKITADSSVGGANVFAGSVLLKNTATGAESLWPLLKTGMSSFIFPHVVQSGDWQGSFTLSNLGSATASLKASAVLLVRGDGGSLVAKAVDGIFSIPAGGVLAGPELSKFGISQQGEVLGGYLKVEPVNPTADVNLAPAGMLFHTKGKGGIIDGLSSLPVVK